jgi:hypothetical protein
LSGAEPNSVANPSHDAAAASIGAAPGPERSRDEMISGGDVRKLIARVSFRSTSDHVSCRAGR